MIWLASFPRSGNTFFRNVLYEVYGLESSTYHQDPNRSLDENYHSYAFVKTHELPDNLTPDDPEIPSIYLVRDGRDSLVSMAHHRKDIVEPGSDFEHNLIEAIIARRGSHFGGWSKNVDQWTKKASLVIRFEDLIVDPIKEIEKLRAIIDLPQPKVDRLPSFQDLKYGRPKYGGGQDSSFNKNANQKNFRKGKSGGFAEEMTPEMEDLFWVKHGKTMESLGYQRKFPPKVMGTKNVLIEGSKFFNTHVDGVSRYINSLVQFIPILLDGRQDWQIDLLHKNELIPIQQAGVEKSENPDQLILEHEYERNLLSVKDHIKKWMPIWLYKPLREIYVTGPIRSILKKIRQNVNRRQIDKLKLDLRSINREYDVLHAPVPQSLQFLAEVGGKFVTTVHDATHLLKSDLHLEENVEETESGMQLVHKFHSHVISVSNHTKQDLETHYGWPDHKITTIYQGIDPDLFHPRWRNRVQDHKDKQYNLPEGQFFLSLSTLEPRKNIVSCIKAFQLFKSRNPQSKVKLVIAGRKGWKWDDILEEGKDKDIIFTGYIEDEDLPYIYARSHAFIYISLYEGFGLPLIEAMGCGTPVIYGNNSAMKEVVGDSGLPVDAHDLDAIEKSMGEMMTNDKLWLELSEKGRSRACKYTWLKTAFHTVNTYQNLISR